MHQIDTENLAFVQHRDHPLGQLTKAAQQRIHKCQLPTNKEGTIDRGSISQSIVVRFQNRFQNRFLLIMGSRGLLADMAFHSMDHP